MPNQFITLHKTAKIHEDDKAWLNFLKNKDVEILQTELISEITTVPGYGVYEVIWKFKDSPRLIHEFAGYRMDTVISAQ